MAYTFVLSREPEMSADVLEAAQGIIADRLPNYPMENLVYDKQGDSCTYASDFTTM